MIIVTGGAGFIGSNVVRALNVAGERDILVVDNLTRGDKHRNLNALQFADYVDRDDLVALLPKLPRVRAVLHQGACSDTTERDGKYMMRNNYRYSQELLRFCEDHGARFIYASSAATYGDGQRGFREEPRCEYPLNVYGFSKLAFDNYVRPRLSSSRAAPVGLRYFNVYGPQERHKGRMASVAMHLFDQAKAGGPMKLFEGSDTIVRDFVYVDDVAALNLWLLGNGVRGVFNCGTGEARSFVELGRLVQEAIGFGELTSVPFPADLVGKYQRHTQADLSQLRSAGYTRPFTSLADGVRAYVKTLSDTDGFYRD